ncbi:unnamed protein product [Calypogeia fissa]
MEPLVTVNAVGEGPSVQQNVEVQDLPKATSKNIVGEGALKKESAKECVVQHACASTFSSPSNFCFSNAYEKLVWAGSFGSPVVLQLSDKLGSALGKTGYTYMDAPATHFV